MVSHENHDDDAARATLGGAFKGAGRRASHVSRQRGAPSRWAGVPELALHTATSRCDEMRLTIVPLPGRRAAAAVRVALRELPPDAGLGHGGCAAGGVVRIHRAVPRPATSAR